jgi:hypothetical protein
VCIAVLKISIGSMQLWIIMDQLSVIDAT